MALNLGELFFQLSVRTDGLTRAERHARRFADRTESHFDRVRLASVSLGRALGLVAVIAAAKYVTDSADAYSVLQQRIRSATKSLDDYNTVSKEIFNISNRNGTSLATNIALFQDLSRVAPSLNATNKEILVLADVVGQLGVIGGSSSDQMSNGILQFTQGIAEGTFRAEEFNSIMSNLPEVVARIAKGFGLNSSELRNAVNSGKVLSKDVFTVLIEQAKEIREETEKINTPIDRAGVALKNSFSTFLGQLNDATGWTDTIAQNIENLAKFFAQDFTPIISGIREEFYKIADSVKDWLDLFGTSDEISKYAEEEAKKTKKILSFLGNSLIDAIKYIYDSLLNLPQNLKTLYKLTVEFFSGSFAQVDVLNAKMRLGWEAVKFTASKASQKVQLLWVRAIDKILTYFAIGLRKVSELGYNVPFLSGIFRDLGNQAKKVGEYANKEAILIKKFEKENEVRIDKIKTMEAELQLLEITAEEYRLLSAKNIDNILKEHAEVKRLAKARADARKAARNKGKSEGSGDKKDGKNKLDRFSVLPDEDADAKAKAKAERDLAQGNFSNLENSLLTDLEIENNHYAASQELFENAELLGLETELGFNEVKERIKENHLVKLASMNKEYWQGTNDMNKLASFAGINLDKISYGQSVRASGEHFSNLLNNAAQHSKAFFLIQKALALATAAIEAPRAVLSAFAFGNAVGGPPLGFIFAGIAGAAVAVQVAAIAASSFQGKAVGGNVFAGGAYKVNESGAELLSVGNSDYLMMGSQSGTITPNNQLGSMSNSNVVVNVYPGEGQTAQVEEEKTDTSTQISVMIEKIEQKIADGVGRGGSALSESLESQYGLNRSIGAYS